MENVVKCHKAKQFLKALKEDYVTYQATTAKFRERYENKQDLFRAVMVDCPPPRPTIETPENLGLLERNIRAHISVLKHCDGYSVSTLICHLMEGSLHNTTFSAWRAASKKLPRPPTADDLLHFLHEREEALFVMDPPERQTKKERLSTTSPKSSIDLSSPIPIPSPNQTE